MNRIQQIYPEAPEGNYFQQDYTQSNPYYVNVESFVKVPLQSDINFGNVNDEQLYRNQFNQNQGPQGYQQTNFNIHYHQSNHHYSTEQQRQFVPQQPRYIVTKQMCQRMTALLEMCAALSNDVLNPKKTEETNENSQKKYSPRERNSYSRSSGLNINYTSINVGNTYGDGYGGGRVYGPRDHRQEEKSNDTGFRVVIAGIGFIAMAVFAYFAGKEAGNLSDKSEQLSNMKEFIASWHNDREALVATQAIKNPEAVDTITKCAENILSRHKGDYIFSVITKVIMAVAGAGLIVGAILYSMPIIIASAVVLGVTITVVLFKLGLNRTEKYDKEDAEKIRSSFIDLQNSLNSSENENQQFQFNHYQQGFESIYK